MKAQTVLLDTDVVIEILKRSPQALAWLASLAPDDELTVTGYTVMEILQGARDRIDMQRLVTGMQQAFRTVWPTEADRERAIRTFADWRLSHGLGLIDALIGECAVGIGAPIRTFNQRHYGVIPNLQVAVPYVRTVPTP